MSELWVQLRQKSPLKTPNNTLVIIAYILLTQNSIKNSKMLINLFQILRKLFNLALRAGEKSKASKTDLAI
jgi:hypothetical protein